MLLLILIGLWLFETFEANVQLIRLASSAAARASLSPLVRAPARWCRSGSRGALRLLSLEARGTEFWKLENERLLADLLRVRDERLRQAHFRSLDGDDLTLACRRGKAATKLLVELLVRRRNLQHCMLMQF